MSFLSWWGTLSSQRKSLVYLVGGIVLTALGLTLQTVPGVNKQVAALTVGLGVGGCVLGVIGFLMPDLHDMGTAALRRRYYRETSVAMAGLIVAGLLLQRFGDTEALWLRVVLALLPAAMVFMALLAYMRFVRHADELLRRIELESIGFAVLVACTASVAALLLQEMKLFAWSSGSLLQLQALALALGYVLARIVVARRYQ